jgi:conjugative relaxase-like TrwC/TraI family protein
MLGVTPLTDRGGGYYLADLAAELGPLRANGADRDSTAPGRWVGTGAEGLGLRGPVDGGDLGLVLSGTSPSTGRRLTGRPASVSAFDLTFSAPKSVSVLLALGTPEVSALVVGAHEEAVRGALGYVAGHAAAVRRGHRSEREVLGVHGVVAAAFTHGVSRALDPHLHTHVLVANLAQGSDGRWSALDGRGLFAHRRAAGALYDAHLRQALSAALGVDWATRGAAHEVAGIDPVVLGGFSQRRAEIRAHLAERDLRSGPADRVAWAATREPKAPGPTRREVADLWAQRSAALGAGPTDLGAVLDRPVVGHRAVDEHRFGAALAAAGPAAVTRRQVVGAWAGALPGGATAQAVGDCVDQLLPDLGVGVAEPGFAPAQVSAPAAARRALGPRPPSPGPLAVWLQAARHLDRYRDRWGEFRPSGAVGMEYGLHRAAPAQLAEYLAVSRELRAARRALGREPVRAERESLGLARG